MTDRIDTETLQTLVNKATKGPWKLAGESTGYVVANEESALLAVVGDYKDTDLLPYNKERWDADASLFAAAKALAAEVLELRALVGEIAPAMAVMHAEGKAAFDVLDLMRSRLHVMHRRAQKAETAKWREFGPYGWLIKPIGLAEDEWHLSWDPDPSPDVACVPLFAREALALGETVDPTTAKGDAHGRMTPEPRSIRDHNVQRRSEHE